MNRHQLLYKENSSRAKENRGRVANENRKYQRQNLQNFTRNLSSVNDTLTAKSSESNIDLKIKENSKSKHKEDFIKKYVAWKNKKQEEQEKIKEKKKPFIVPGTSKGTSIGNMNSVKFPMRSSKFKPPEGLKNPIIERVGQSEYLLRTESRRSIYTLVDTPTKPLCSATQSSAKAIAKKSANPKPIKLATEKNGSALVKPVKHLRKVVTNIKSVANPTAVASEANNKYNVRKIFKKQIGGSENEVKTRKAFVAPRIKITPAKNPTNPATTRSSSKNVKKVPSSKKINSKKLSPPILKLNTKTLAIIEQNDSLRTIEAPQEDITQFTISCHFTSAVTSTTTKNSNSGDRRLSDTFSDTISPVEHIKLPDLIPMVNHERIESVKKKFQFVRYTEVMPTTPISTKKEKSIIDSKEDAPEIPKSQPIADNETPPKTLQNDGNQSINYLSPFVTVSRGKVNSQKEKEKRKSIYLPNKESNDDISEKQMELRRTLETASYFQKQLKEEHDRLKSKCDLWETYKTQNDELLAESGGDDMINAAIGQTKLLTSKKLKQFGNLIEQCKNCALAKSNGEVLKDDGSESTKMILAEDLEGFWCVIGQQIENLDKRFKNLERWKSNNWIDPEMANKSIAFPKNKKNLTKVTKAKSSKRPIHASSALKDMLRKVHAAYKMNKNAAGNATSPLVILTPSKKKPCFSISPPRISVIVQDRRSRSIAPTVITVNSTRKCIRKSSVDSPKIQSKDQDVENLHKSAMISAELQKYDNFQGKSPEIQPSSFSRRSILKTPGTASKTNTPRRIAFNEQPLIRKFKFVNEEVLEVSNEE